MIIETDVAPWLMPVVTLRMRRYPLDHADNHHGDDDVFHDDHDQNGLNLAVNLLTPIFFFFFPSHIFQNPVMLQGVYMMILRNFERHYQTNRAPFGLFYHPAWWAKS